MSAVHMCVFPFSVCHCMFLLEHFFFFDEDEIRDWLVPGVQTCPLPFRACPGTNVPWQPDSQGLRAGDLSARGISAALEETRESKQIEAFVFLKAARGVGEHGIDFSEQSCQPAQVHLVVAHNSG